MKQSVESRARWGSAGVLALLVSVGASETLLAQSWPTAGADLSNSHFQAAEDKISRQTAQNLKLKWKFATAGDVTAIPAVAGGYVYFPDSAGYIYKVDASTGQLIWSQQVSAITGVAGDFARATPAVTGKMLIIGSQTGRFFGQNGNYATEPQVFALSTVDGHLIWQTTVDQTPQAFVTTSAVIAPGSTKGIAIVGVASNEELTAAFVAPAYWQWQFRGSALALDVATGKILWQTFTVPPGYFGGPIWGSTPSVDLARKQVYVSTGDNYMVPSAALNCLASGGSSTGCLDPADYADSILALDLTTGKIKWAGRGMPDDVWSVACGLAIPPFNFYLLPPYPSPFPTAGIFGNCPDPSGNANPKVVGPDYDFAQGPMLFPTQNAQGNSNSQDNLSLVGAGEKSGVFWTFSAQNGQTVWSTQVSPGGVTGGMQWGSATDGSTIYVSASNAGPSLNGGGAGAQPWQQFHGGVAIPNDAPSVGGWAAVNATTGAIKWTTPVPNPYNLPTYYGIRAEGPVTLANGVVYGCDMTGTYHALNANSGDILWSMSLSQLTNGASTGNGCIAGAAIVNGMVYWGSGDGRGSPSAAKALFAFGL